MIHVQTAVAAVAAPMDGRMAVADVVRVRRRRRRHGGAHVRRLRANAKVSRGRHDLIDVARQRRRRLIQLVQLRLRVVDRMQTLCRLIGIVIDAGAVRNVL